MVLARGKHGHSSERRQSVVLLRLGMLGLGFLLCGTYMALAPAPPIMGAAHADEENAGADAVSAGLGLASPLERGFNTDVAGPAAAAAAAVANVRRLSREEVNVHLKGHDDDAVRYDKDVNPTGVITCKTNDQPDICRGFGADSCKRLDEGSEWVLLVMVATLLYLFVGIAIVCDELFVPALEIIAQDMKLSNDVAGATLMAAGGSAPELATAFVGTFQRSDVGFGTIVGSAVFNVLFVIGACVLATPVHLRPLPLTWWPLFRDCSYYVVTLVALVLFMVDGVIEAWEAAVQLGLYFGYVFLMGRNGAVEAWVKGKLAAPAVAVAPLDLEAAAVAAPAAIASGPAPIILRGRTATEGSAVFDRARSGGSFREGSSFDKGPGLKLRSFDRANSSVNNTPDASFDKANGLQAAGTSAGTAVKELELAGGGGLGGGGPGGPSEAAAEAAAEEAFAAARLKRVSLVPEEKEGEPEDDGEPAQSMWQGTMADLRGLGDPTKSLAGKALVVACLPLTLAFCLIPDCRPPGCEKWAAATFAGSIVMIGLMAIVMVECATVFGDTLGIPGVVMGLTILAAGTSVPDLLSSVIVAQKGQGDMAVSSSIGSNIFDVAFGLPVPWLVFSLVAAANGCNCGVVVESDGLVSSLLVLLLMVALIVVAIWAYDWKMTNGLGYSMFVGYFFYLAFALLTTPAELYSVPSCSVPFEFKPF